MVSKNQTKSSVFECFNYFKEDFLKLIRLYLKPDVDTTEQLRFGDLILDIGTRRAIYNSKVIDLTMKEFELLKFLMEHPREVLSRVQILENVEILPYK